MEREIQKSGTGAQLLTETLARAGVRTIFSLSGNQIMPVYDACIDAGLRIVHVRHEAAAVAMADAYAQLTREVGVALVTAAPGFLNALSPLYSARLSESPVLLLSGDSPVAQDGMGAFQELPQTAISGPLAKRAVRPLRARDLGLEAASAIRAARAGRPGPVHMALAFDVLCAQTGSAVLPGTQDFVPQRQPLDPGMADRIAALAAEARRPVVLAGPSLSPSRAGDLAARLSQRLAAPVVPMESPRGLRDPALGAFAEELARADLVVLLGKTPDFTTGFLGDAALAEGATLVAIDPETDALDRAWRLAGERIVLAACADTRAAAETLAAGTPLAARADWAETVARSLAWRGGEPASGAAIHPVAVCRAVQRVLDAAQDAVLVCDGGEFGQWAQGYCTAGTRIINGMSGAIGSGLCYAIAAKIARPGATVVAMMGDGTVGFHLAEFETALREDAPFIALIGNDSRWNAEYQIQLRDYGADRLIGCELTADARYDAVARALGCEGTLVTDAAALPDALADAATAAVPACVNVGIEGAPAPLFTRTGKPAASAH